MQPIHIKDRCHCCMTNRQVEDEEDSLQTWRVAVSVLNNLLQTFDKGWSSIWGFVRNTMNLDRSLERRKKRWLPFFEDDNETSDYIKCREFRIWIRKYLLLKKVFFPMNSLIIFQNFLGGREYCHEKSNCSSFAGSESKDGSRWYGSFLVRGVAFNDEVKI